MLNRAGEPTLPYLATTSHQINVTRLNLLLLAIQLSIYLSMLNIGFKTRWPRAAERSPNRFIAEWYCLAAILRPERPLSGGMSRLVLLLGLREAPCVAEWSLNSISKLHLPAESTGTKVDF